MNIARLNFTRHAQVAIALVDGRRIARRRSGAAVLAVLAVPAVPAVPAVRVVELPQRLPQRLRQSVAQPS